MADLSLSKLLSRKKKLRVVTIVCGLILVGALSAIFVSKNPRGIKAVQTCDIDNKILVIEQNSTIENNNVISGTNCALNQNVEDWDVTLNGNYYLFLAGENRFKSLTIQNGGTVTHDSVLPTDIAADRFTLLPNGQRKKVDVQLTGDLKLLSGGKINVNGQGYPGAPDDSGLAGYGPGRGGGSIDSGGDQEPSGGGGGFGGEGGTVEGRNSPPGIGGVVNPATFDVTNPYFDFGSGGGSGTNNTGPTGREGGNGGGRVRIKTKAGISIDFASGSNITANGNPAYCDNNTAGRSGCGGAGAGGMIHLEAATFSLVTGTPDVSGGASFEIDGAGAIGFAHIESSPGSISAKGGYATSFEDDSGDCGDGGCRASGGGGGGGRIVVNKIVVQPITIKKELQPLRRTSLSADCPDPDSPDNTNPNCTFNPYALQSQDLIRVKLTVSNMIPGLLDLSEEMLEIKYANPATWCEYQNGTLVGGTVTNYLGKTLVFSDTISNPPPISKIYYYRCLVSP